MDYLSRMKRGDNTPQDDAYFISKLKKFLPTAEKQQTLAHDLRKFAEITQGVMNEESVVPDFLGGPDVNSCNLRIQKDGHLRMIDTDRLVSVAHKGERDSIFYMYEHLLNELSRIADILVDNNNGEVKEPVNK